MKEAICEEHVGQDKRKCACQQPFCSFYFPRENPCKANRLECTKRMKREKPDTTQLLPRSSDRVCSEHLLGGAPTEDEFICEVISALSDHTYSLPESVVPCLSCCNKTELIKSLCQKVASMSLQMRNVKDRQDIFNIRNTIFSWNQIKTDRKMLFYIGLPNKTVFNTVFSLIEAS